jgi:rod shape-determining protein MreB
LLGKKIGIDLGTSTVLVYVKGEGVVINEPSPAGDNGDRSRTLHHFIGKVQGRQRLFRPEIMICVPSGVSSAERRAVTEAAISAGARQVWLIDEPLAAAIGAGLPIAELRGNTVCDIGGSTTEIAVISLSGMVVAHSIPVGGRRIDEAIATYFKRRYNLDVDEHTAEQVKIAVGSAIAMKEPLRIEVRGREVTSNDVVEAIQEQLHLIAAAVSKVLEETPPELAADIRDRGIVLTGGGAQLPGLDRYLSLHTGITATVAKDPQTSVVRGTGLALEQFEVLKRSQSLFR